SGSPIEFNSHNQGTTMARKERLAVVFLDTQPGTRAQTAANLFNATVERLGLPLGAIVQTLPIPWGSAYRGDQPIYEGVAWTIGMNEKDLVAAANSDDNLVLQTYVTKPTFEFWNIADGAEQDIIEEHVNQLV